MRKLKDFNRSFLILTSIFNIAYAANLDIAYGTKNDPHLAISHCYHWLDEANDKYLTYKYNYAKNNKDELTFYTTYSTSNGSVAGPGLYCAKSPSGSYSYGDRLIRVDLVDDIVMLDSTTGKKYCGIKGEDSTNSEECAQKEWDIKFYNGGGIGNSAWYVIQNPMAVSQWSATSDQLLQDLNVSIGLNDRSFRNHAQSTIERIKVERSEKGERIYINGNARLSIIDFVLNSPDKLDQIPPLNIVLRVAKDKSGRLGEDLKKEVISKYILRALESDGISFQDFLDVFGKTKILKSLFFENISHALGDLKDFNSGVILETILRYPKEFSAKVSEDQYREMTNEIFSNHTKLRHFATSNIEFIPVVKKYFDAELLKSEKEKIDFQKVSVISPLIDKIYTSKQAQNKKSIWKSKVFSTKKSDIVLNIGKESFQVPSGLEDMKSYCSSAFDFSEKQNKLSLEINSREFVLFKRKSKIKKKEVCSLISENWKSIVDVQDEKEGRDLYVIKGHVEEYPFLLFASTRDQVKNQCSKFYNTIQSVKEIDSITFTINGKNRRYAQNRNSYWDTEEKVCGEINNALIGFIQSKDEIRIKKEAEKRYQKEIENYDGLSKVKSLFLVKVRYEKESFIYYGESKNQILNQCKDKYKHIKNKEIDTIFYTLPNQSEKRAYNSVRYWESSLEICNKINELIGDSIP